MTRMTSNMNELTARSEHMRGKERAQQHRLVQNAEETATKGQAFSNLLVRVAGENRSRSASESTVGNQNQNADVISERQLESDHMSKSLLPGSSDEIQTFDGLNGKSVGTQTPSANVTAVPKRATDANGDKLEQRRAALGDTASKEPGSTEAVRDGEVAALSRRADATNGVDVSEVVTSEGAQKEAELSGPAVDAAPMLSALDNEASMTFSGGSRSKVETADEVARAIEAGRRAPAFDVSTREPGPAGATVVGSVLSPHRATIGVTAAPTSGSSSAGRAVHNPLGLERTAPGASNPADRLNDRLNRAVNSETLIAEIRLPRAALGNVEQTSRWGDNATRAHEVLGHYGDADATIGEVRQEVHFAIGSVQNVSVAGTYKQIASDLATSGDIPRMLAETKATAGVNGPIASPAPLKMLHIQLQPKELGEIAVRIALRGDKVELRIQTARPSTAEVLKSDHKALVAALQGENFDIDSVTVQIVEPERSLGGQSSTSMATGQSKLVQGEHHQAGAEGDAQRQNGDTGKEDDQSETGHRRQLRDYDERDVSDRNKGIIL